jgi:hypothetical protein
VSSVQYSVTGKYFIFFTSCPLCLVTSPESFWINSFCILGLKLQRRRLLFIKFLACTFIAASNFASNYTRRSQSHVTTDDQSASKSWFQGPSGSHDRILISVDIYCFIDVWRPLWREVGSVIFHSHYPSIVSKYIQNCM